MKKSISTRLLSAFLAFVMVFLMIPFSAIMVLAETETTLPQIDYTPFLIESIGGKTIYNAKTADMTYAFYRTASKTIENDEKDYMQQGVLYPEDYGFDYTPASVYYIKPDDVPSCGLLVCVLNYDVNGQDMHTMLIAFKGTDGINDVVTDLLATDLSPSDGYHDGFYSTAQKHLERLTSLSFDMERNNEKLLFGEYINKMKESDNYNMIVTGHSLGAAVANIFTAKFINPTLGEKADESVVAYTYATPLTCSYDNKNATNIFNLINKNDWVPRVGYAVTDSEAIFGELIALGTASSIIFGYTGVNNIIYASAVYASIEESYRVGYDLKASAGNRDERYVLWEMTNHSMKGAYSSIKSYINQNINNYFSTFVLYSNYDAKNHKHQTIIYDRGNLLVSGNGTLAGDWTENTLIEWAKVKNDCTSLIFEPDCSITEIGDYAFAGMSQLSNELELPETVTKIGDYAFFHCGFSDDLIIPAAMKEVGINAFNGCSNLDSINAKDAIAMTWEYGAFANCVHSDYLTLPIEDLGVDLKEDIFSKYYVEDSTGIYQVSVKDSTSGNFVLPGDKIYYGRLFDEQIRRYPTFDFHYFLTEGNVDTQQSIEAQSSTTIENVASIDEFGCITVSPSCEANKEFTVVVLYDLKGDPNYSVRESTYYIHFTVGTINDRFSGGIGTEKRPYLIKNSDQLARISDDLSAHYKLICDIPFNGESLSPLGTLTGGLDGNGYAIYGFNMSIGSNAGLFTQVAEKAYVKNLTIGGSSNQDEYMATISAGNNTIKNKELIAGGICAINYGKIENCTIGKVKVYAGRNVDRGNEYKLISIVGGVSGRNYGTIKNCVVQNSYMYAYSKTAKDTSPAKCYAYSGGIVGINDGTISLCSSLKNDNIKGYSYSHDDNVIFTDWDEGEAQTYCGGLMARNNNWVNNCYVYENNLEAKASGDGGEGTDIKKESTYIAVEKGTQVNCNTSNTLTTYAITSLKLISEPNKKHYYIGEELNLYGLLIQDDRNNPVNGYTVSGFSSEKSGTRTLTVTYVTGYGTFEDIEFTVTVDNIIPEVVIVTPNHEQQYDINTTLGLKDFSATIYYNNGTMDQMESLVPNELDFVKFSPFTTLLNMKGTQNFQLNYSYVYRTNDGTPVTTLPIFVNVALTVNCDCSSRTTLNATPATVSEYGYTGDLVCLTCQSIVEEGAIIDKLEPTDHNYGAWEKLDDTQHSRACDCGKIDYAPHIWNDGTITKPSTHLVAGELTKMCYDCGATKIERINPTANHSFGGWEKLDETQHIRICECGKTESKDHSWDDGTITTPATYEKDGVKTYMCSECEATYTVVIPKPLDIHLFVIDDAGTIPGGSMQVNVRLENNPGVAMMRLKISYDSSVLTLDQVTYNADIGGTTIEPVIFDGYVILLWYNDSENVAGDWIFATLSFTVKETVTVGSVSDIILTYDAEEVCDIEENNIVFFADNGSASVLDHVPGDTNGDCGLNSKDLLRLARYFAGWDVEVNENALDVNGDGTVNSKDLLRLARYLAGWDVEIH